MKEKILSQLGAGHIWAGSLRYYPTIDSTNTEAKRLAEQGAPNGTVLVADHQTGGRGRMGRSFHSPEKAGVYLSVILRFDCKAPELSHLTCAAGTAMCNAIEKVTGIRPGVKWINDLVIQGRKLGGILTELSIRGNGAVDYAVVGIGINCNQEISDFPEEIKDIATSLSHITGRSVDRTALIGQMIIELEQVFNSLLTDKRVWITRYKADCITIGQEIQVIKADTQFYGKALDINEDGSLIIATESGQILTVNSGEVHIRGLYGYC